MPRDGSHDFDFLFGSWTVLNRRLVERLKGSTEWEEFPSTCHARPVLAQEPREQVEHHRLVLGDQDPAPREGLRGE